jgi:DNA ligase (NAD+)
MNDIKYLKIPNHCPECGAETYIDRSGKSEILMCSNPDCSAVLLGLWKTFVSKQGMDIRGLSEATLETLLRLGYINNMFVTIYELHKYSNKICQLDGFGTKSVDKLMKAIEDSKDVSLSSFITAFSIPGVGPSQSKAIAEKYKTFEKFAAACDNQERFNDIPGIGEVLNLQIINWWANNYIQMFDVAGVVRFKDDEFMNVPVSTTPIKELTFVITGAVSHFKNRGELQKKIESLGGKCTGSVSKNTDFLINNDKTSETSKNLKAKQLGVKIISESEFLDMIK